MASFTNGDATLEELFVQIKNEFISKRNVDENIVRAHFLAHVKQGQEFKTKDKNNNLDKVDKFTYKRVGVFVLVSVLSILVVAAAVGAAMYKDELIEFLQSTKCMFDKNLLVDELIRPVFNCELCRNMDCIERLSNISRQEFLEKYAYTKIPVVITGATDKWKALDTFSFKYFKKLYSARRGEFEDWQFINWRFNNVNTLKEAFNMTDARANLEPGEDSWYIGWSNYDEYARRELRMNYNRPYFLPEGSGSSLDDWIFMGWPGPGASLHIDILSRPWWQAQISGRKKWTFVSVPECEGICTDKYEVIVEKGYIIVFDSNQWYHATFVMPGDISITIGSEYD